MGSAPPSSEIVRFADFELDSPSGELRRAGSKLKLQDQPFQILQILSNVAYLEWLEVPFDLDGAAIRSLRRARKGLAS